MAAEKNTIETNKPANNRTGIKTLYKNADSMIFFPFID